MRRPRGSAEFRVALGLAFAVLAFLVVPMVVIVPVSVTPNRYLSLPSGTISFRHYAALATDPDWRRGAVDSAVVATAAASLAIVLGTASAIGCWRLASRATDWVRFVMLAPMIVPPVVHAVGMYRVWAGFGLIDTYAGLVLAHAMKGIPFVVISVSAALANFDPRLEQAARSLGAGPIAAVRLAVLPNIWPGTLAGGVFAFAISWDEVVVALFLTSRSVYTLPRKIWDGIQDNINPAIAAVASLLIVLTVAGMLVRILRARRRTRLSALAATA